MVHVTVTFTLDPTEDPNLETVEDVSNLVTNLVSDSLGERGIPVFNIRVSALEAIVRCKKCSRFTLWSPVHGDLCPEHSV